MKFGSSLFSLLTAASLLLVPFTATAQTLADVAEGNGLSTLLAAATATGQISTLATETVELTLFGPTDAAFDALPAGTVNWLLRNENLGILSQIVGFHVLPGVVRSTDLSDGLEEMGKVFSAAPNQGVGFTVNGAGITASDVPASNGVLHIIDQVLIPPELEAFPSNLIQVASADANFATLVRAIGVAGLAAFLTDGTFTVFAPTEAAWADLPLGTLAYLMRLPNVLGQVLQYHVIDGLVPSSMLTDGREVATLLGGNNPDLLLRVSVDTPNNVTLINGVAAIQATDVETLNGFIDVIDQVLIPPGLTIIKYGQFNGH
jgi:transforming growth factor-beta-induced protein